MVEVNKHFDNNEIKKRPTIQNYIANGLKMATVYIDFKDALPDERNLRKYKKGSRYEIEERLTKAGVKMNSIIEVIPTFWTGWVHMAGQGDTDGTPYNQSDTTELQITSIQFDHEIHGWRFYVQEKAGAGNTRQIREVTNNEYITHVQMRVLVIGT